MPDINSVRLKLFLIKEPRIAAALITKVEVASERFVYIKVNGEDADGLPLQVEAVDHKGNRPYPGMYIVLNQDGYLYISKKEFDAKYQSTGGQITSYTYMFSEKDYI